MGDVLKAAPTESSSMRPLLDSRPFESQAGIDSNLNPNQDEHVRAVFDFSRMENCIIQKREIVVDPFAGETANIAFPDSYTLSCSCFD